MVGSESLFRADPRIWPIHSVHFRNRCAMRGDFLGELPMNIKSLRILAGLGITALLFAMGCGGGASSSTPPGGTNNTTGTVHFIVSDDATEDWATIGVKVLSVSLVPQSGSAVTVYTAPSTPPVINLLQLDQLGEIIGNASVPVGTYTAAKLTLSGNPGDVMLVTSGDPEAGFDLGAGYTVPSSSIQIMGATGASGSMTVPLTVKLADPLTVTANSTNALDLEFDLKSPAFIVEHCPAGCPATTAPTWAVNFNGPVRHHPRPILTDLLLRHTYGQVTSVSTDNTSIVINKAFPVHPITNPETATVSSTSLTITADSANGTIFYNMDTGGTPTTINNFQQLAATLPNMYVRIAARYQQNGTLVATRILASSSFDKVWKNPEGHVLHVNTTTNVMHVTTEDGNATAIKIGPNTNFYYQTGNTPLNTSGGGQAFFDGKTAGGLPNVARGFKVNVTIDPLSSSTPPTALSVEIDIARYDGAISSPTGTGFVYTRKFAMADARSGMDNYSGTLDYISSTSANTDQQGNAIAGFYWWNFAYPTLADTGTNAVSDFEAAADGSVKFNGYLVLPTKGGSHATWNDPAAADSWAANWTVLVPTPAPLGLISAPFSTASNNFSFSMPSPSTAPTGTPAAFPVVVDLSVASGSATLVYQIDRQAGAITVTPQDISNPTTLATVAGNLVVNVPVKVFGVPQADGSIKAYTLFYFTHTASTK